MKAINYTYADMPLVFTIIADNDEDSMKLFHDIFKAKQDGRESMVIIMPDGLKVITPIKIIDMTIGNHQILEKE